MSHAKPPTAAPDSGGPDLASPNLASPDLESLAENLPGNVYRRVRTPDGRYRFEYLSNGLFRQFGIDHRRLLAEPALRFDWVHPDDTARFVSDLEVSAATLGVLDHRIRVIGTGGRVHWARGIARPSRRADGSVVWDGIVIDVTREIEAEAALRVAKEEADRAHREAAEAITAASEGIMAPLADLEALLADAALGDGLRRQLAAISASLRALPSSVGDGRRPTVQAAPPDRVLTRRQGDVLTLMRAGLSNKAIAQKLGITPGTAKLHAAAVLRLTGARRRAELRAASPRTGSA